jgi:Lon protease-like protein
VTPSPDDLSALAAFAGTARLFPLPNLVLFPQVVQGLHVFEPRYRQMMADAVAGDMLIALALLRPGWEKEYDGRPPIEPVACLGRVGPYEELPDGRYNLRLKGLARVRVVEEVPTDRLYRVARVELIPDAADADLARLVELRRELTEAVLARFPADGSAHRQLAELLAGDTPLGAVCDLLGYALPLPLDLKQRLLAEPRAEVRAEVLADALRVKAAARDRKFPPDFSAN